MLRVFHQLIPPCVYAFTHTHAHTLAVRSLLHIASLSLSLSHMRHPLIYALYFFFSSYLNFHFSPIVFFSVFKTHRLLFCILSFCWCSCPFSPPPFSSPPSSFFFFLFFFFFFFLCLRLFSHHLLVLFHARVLSLSLPHNTPNHPRDQACLLCLFHISALCSCDGNLSFKYLFLPSPDFFFFFFFFNCFPHWCRHQRTPHPLPEIFKLRFFQLGSWALLDLPPSIQLYTLRASEGVRPGTPAEANRNFAPEEFNQVSTPRACVLAAFPPLTS